MTQRIELPGNGAAAADALKDASNSRDVVVFKRSPICPVSHRAEAEFTAWVETLPEDSSVAIAVIDVIEQRELARGLTEALGIQHESPQALCFRQGELSWHDSHSALTRARFLASMEESSHS